MLAASVLLGVVAGGAGVYAVIQVPGAATVAARVEGPLVLRLDRSLGGIPARE
jgi:hypothetical protein